MKAIAAAFLLLTIVPTANGEEPLFGEDGYKAPIVAAREHPFYSTFEARAVVSAAVLAIVLLVVIVHYESLVTMTAMMKRLRQKRLRAAFVLLILGVLAAHTIAMWLFAIGYYVLIDEFGILYGLPQPTLLECMYYSATVYSTLGFGDLVPVGPIQLLTGVESVTGLVLITWSASFTFLEMQKGWRT